MSSDVIHAGTSSVMTEHAVDLPPGLVLSVAELEAMSLGGV